MTSYLELADLTYVIDQLFPSTTQSIVKDWGLLESALYRPRSTVFGEEAYPRVHDKAAALLHSLARNHPLHDGNKRLAWLSARLFYVFNEFDLRAPSAATGDKFVRSVASGDYEVPAVATVLLDWTKPLT